MNREDENLCSLYHCYTAYTFIGFSILHDRFYSKIKSKKYLQIASPSINTNIPTTPLKPNRKTIPNIIITAFDRGGKPTSASSTPRVFKPQRGPNSASRNPQTHTGTLVGSLFRCGVLKKEPNPLLIAPLKFPARSNWIEKHIECVAARRRRGPWKLRRGFSRRVRV